mmetsp:Transcript_7298/g.15943  ORF Transcript_7298/g.15943 Transcript_7298/m.15943 type:complete len:81 (+) Transcript_7298:471-713(+)
MFHIYIPTLLPAQQYGRSLAVQQSVPLSLGLLACGSLWADAARCTQHVGSNVRQGQRSSYGSTPAAQQRSLHPRCCDRMK